MFSFYVKVVAFPSSFGTIREIGGLLTQFVSPQLSIERQLRSAALSPDSHHISHERAEISTSKSARPAARPMSGSVGCTALLQCTAG